MQGTGWWTAALIDAARRPAHQCVSAKLGARGRGRRRETSTSRRPCRSADRFATGFWCSTLAAHEPTAPRPLDLTLRRRGRRPHLPALLHAATHPGLALRTCDRSTTVQCRPAASHRWPVSSSASLRPRFSEVPRTRPCRPSSSHRCRSSRRSSSPAACTKTGLPIARTASAAARRGLANSRSCVTAASAHMALWRSASRFCSARVLSPDCSTVPG